ncbi:DNA-binding MarR family transcriptional regulator [Actinoplanes campanulatus]|uniref:DNA-binding MarR family transcriptional regulator n=1 Tax=Actinoplanes campanulatus TaxID=113559 RepID=A0A7W5FCI9_9ACTN|nr:MarR family transcriptional regulator [Actinoplanes campanulatus]MBB3093429.1 DNA-binding MarR family transcriptional regulator [Actinoplanes campanulatus]GGN50137.1 MarR family transcriptional regulator [Actinoplanes campanulatus]GID42455.1 MarR family transcriptional regulator [Actinoplanes campanulatus]
MEPEAALIDQWRSLLACYNEVACHLERALQESHGLSLSEFETLDRLTTQNCDKRRMQDLAEAMYLSQSALSRTVTRLVNADLIDRTHCVQDRRGVFVQLTDLGRTRHTEAKATHLAVLAQHLTPTP